jgi:hypothetical protein
MTKSECVDLNLSECALVIRGWRKSGWDWVGMLSRCSVSFPHCFKKKKQYMVKATGKANCKGHNVIITFPRGKL